MGEKKKTTWKTWAEFVNYKKRGQEKKTISYWKYSWSSPALKAKVVTMWSNGDKAFHTHGPEEKRLAQICLVWCEAHMSRSMCHTNLQLKHYTPLIFLNSKTCIDINTKKGSISYVAFKLTVSMNIFIVQTGKNCPRLHTVCISNICNFTHSEKQIITAMLKAHNVKTMVAARNIFSEKCCLVILYYT